MSLELFVGYEPECLNLGDLVQYCQPTLPELVNIVSVCHIQTARQTCARVFGLATNLCDTATYMSISVVIALQNGAQRDGSGCVVKTLR